MIIISCLNFKKKNKLYDINKKTVYPIMILTLLSKFILKILDN